LKKKKMKNAVPKNASYFAVQVLLDMYRNIDREYLPEYTRQKALRAMMTLFSIKRKDFKKAHRVKLLKVQSVEEFEEHVQSLAWSLSSKTINFYDDEDFKEITVCDTTPTLLKTTFLLSHAAKSGVDETVIGLTLRDIMMHIRPILVSKKILSQLVCLAGDDAGNNEWLNWWKQLTQIEKVKNMGKWKNGIVEHATPMKVLREIIFKTETLEELKSELERHHVTVYVTKEEAARLDKKGFKQSVPESGTWEDRYRLCGIEIHEEEVEFPTKDFVPSVTIPYPLQFKGKTVISSTMIFDILSNQKR
jgi:hypothetical protein